MLHHFLGDVDVRALFDGMVLGAAKRTLRFGTTTISSISVLNSIGKRSVFILVSCRTGSRPLCTQFRLLLLSFTHARLAAPGLRDFLESWLLLH